MSETGPLDPYVARELQRRVADGDVSWLRLQHRAGRLGGLRELLDPDDWADLSARVDAGDVAWARRVLGSLRFDERMADVTWGAPPVLPDAEPARQRGRPGVWFGVGAVVTALALVTLGLSQCRGGGTNASGTTAAVASPTIGAATSTTTTLAPTTTSAASTTTVASTTTSVAGTTTSAAVAGAGGATSTTAPTQPILDTAATAGLATFVRAVTAADLAPLLSGTGPYTVLAPSEAAFAKLPAATLQALLNDKAALGRALRYHVLQGRVTAAQLTAGSLRTLEGSNVRIAVSGSQVTVNEAAVTRADVAATNGIVHVIDTVLLPSGFTVGGTAVTVPPRPAGDVIQIATNDGRFGVLLSALGTAGLTATLQGSGPYTLLAPTDAAFRALPPELLTRLLADRATLAKLLTYHVLGGRVASSAAKAGELATVEGDSVRVGLTASGITVDDATVLTADLGATNGVVHAIDRVLVPADVDLTKLGVPLTPPEPFTLTVYFDVDSSTLRPDAAAAIVDAATKIPAGARVALVGVADQRGNAAANQKLSEDRARAVQKAFEAAGLKATYSISARGAEPNTDLQQARRVDITAT